VRILRKTPPLENDEKLKGCSQSNIGETCTLRHQSVLTRTINILSYKWNVECLAPKAHFHVALPKMRYFAPPKHIVHFTQSELGMTK
jgi:hypothetical protein